MNEKLSGEYLADFNEVTKYLKKYAAKGEKLNEVLDDLSELYSDLEAEGAPLSSVHEGSAEDYAKELSENLPRKKVFFTAKRLLLIFACAVLVAGICFYNNSFSCHVLFSVGMREQNPYRSVFGTSPCKYSY